MPRFFSSSARDLVRFLGFDIKNLPGLYQNATHKFTKPGGTAEQELGPLKKVYIKSKGNKPVHRSRFNPADKAPVISATIFGSKATKTCHIYKDGTGTTKKGDVRK
ncbi:hypothetical protein QQZ08_008425 [Neonectria magnoliae]|uniref:Uncharacterized protein n=1 Tax=Neonectria magnoliae TaxID=2732573 RepID=A0ABR1HUS5_9HYPO